MKTRDGYCEHGMYVGGCGIDWICGYCEDGVSMAEVLERKVAAQMDRSVSRIVMMVKAAMMVPQMVLTADVIAWYCAFDECQGAIERRDDYLFDLAWRNGEIAEEVV